MLVAVYGVASAAEAVRLESAGADMIGVLLGRRAHGRVIDEATATEIARSLSSARLCVEGEGGRPVDPHVARRVGARWAQMPWGPPISPTWRQQLNANGLGWLLARVPASDDDDPSWVLGRIAEYGDPAPQWTQLELGPDLEDAWPVLLEPNPDEMDTAGLDWVAARAPVVVSLPLSPRRIRELRVEVPHACGIAITLAGSSGEVPGSVTIDIDAALSLLAALA